MTIKEANKWLYQAEILDLCNGDAKDRQAVDVACRSLEAWENVKEYAEKSDAADRKRYQTAKERADNIATREMALISGRIAARAEMMKAIAWYLSEVEDKDDD